MTPSPKEPTIQPSKIENSTSILSNILSKIVNHKIVSVVALIASLIGIGTPVHDVLRDPDVSSDQNADQSQPFAFPFIVKNNSSWFNMRDAEMYCGIEKIVMTNNRSLEGFSVAAISHTTIGPGAVVNFRCVAASAEGRNLTVTNPGDIIKANINIFVKYTMLGISRTSPRTEFTWDTEGTPHHWIKGKIAD